MGPNCTKMLCGSNGDPIPSDYITHRGCAVKLHPKNEKQHQLRYENATVPPIGLSTRIKMRDAAVGSATGGAKTYRSRVARHAFAGLHGHRSETGCADHEPATCALKNETATPASPRTNGPLSGRNAPRDLEFALTDASKQRFIRGASGSKHASAGGE